MLSLSQNAEKDDKLSVGRGVSAQAVSVGGTIEQIALPVEL